MMDLRIREATADDIEAMHRIRMAVRENRLSDPLRVTVDMYRACLAASGVANTWVAEADGGVVGFSAARVPTRDIWALFVDADCERRGAGRRLLAAAVDWLFARGVPEIVLSTDPGTRADRVYRAAGWVRSPTTPQGEVTFRLTNPASRAEQIAGTAPC